MLSVSYSPVFVNRVKEFDTSLGTLRDVFFKARYMVSLYIYLPGQASFLHLLESILGKKLIP